MTKQKEKIVPVSKIKDIYDGEYLQVWQDGEWVYLAFSMNGTTIAIPLDEWVGFKKEIKNLTK